LLGDLPQEGKMAEALERELRKFRELLPTLLPEEGKFAVIVGDELLGVFESYADALQAGYQAARLNPFLVKRIATTEAVSYFTRDVACLT
jgi:hypothetical protein